MDQSNAGRAGKFSQWTNRTQYARVYSCDGPIGRTRLSVSDCSEVSQGMADRLPTPCLVRNAHETIACFCGLLHCPTTDCIRIVMLRARHRHATSWALSGNSSSSSSSKPRKTPSVDRRAAASSSSVIGSSALAAHANVRA
eukprot:1176782-Prorocentrum_minimum.AAC.2